MSTSGDDSTTGRRRGGGTLTVLGLSLLVLAILGTRAAWHYGRNAGWWGGIATSAPSARPFGGVEDGAARLLAKVLVEAPREGEAMTPRIRYERGWHQWAFLLVFGLGSALIIWLYRREGPATPRYRALLAAIRLTLFLLAMFFLSEAVLSVERTGLPTFVVLADDSASGSVVDPYAEPSRRKAADRLAALSGRPKSDRLAVGLGWLLQDDSALIRELANEQKVAFYRVSDAAVPIIEIDKVEEVEGAVAKLKAIEPVGPQSRLGDCVRSVLEERRGVPPTAILLLSDGRTTDGPRLAEAAEVARKEGVPLYTIGLGDTRPARDLELTDLQVDEVAFVNDLLRFEARLLARGFEGQGDTPATVAVALKRRRPGTIGEEPGDLETLQTIRVPIPPEGQPARVEVAHRPTEVGEVVYVLEVETLPRELQAENNRVERKVSVRDEKIDVLLVEGEPRWEFRYLKTYLARDNTINLSYVLQSSDEYAAAQDPAALDRFPAREAQGTGDSREPGLFDYDVLILGDVDPSYLNNAQMADVAAFVSEKGGGLLAVAGEQFNPVAYRGRPLEPLLPILLAGASNPTADGGAVESYRPELTAEGLNHPIFRLDDDEAASRRIYDALAPSDWYFSAPRKQPAAVVLAEHPEKVGPEGKLPILLYQYYGAGKVLFSARDDTWKWRQRIGDRYFGRYWVQAIRFLAATKLGGSDGAELTTTRRRFPRNQPVGVQVRFPNPARAQNIKSLTVEVRRPGESPRRVTLRPAVGSKEGNRFEGTISGLPEGRYEATLLPPPTLEGSLPATEFTVDPPAGEFVRVEMDREDLTAAAKLSEGRFLRWDESAPTAIEGPNRDESGGVEVLRDLLPTPQQVPLDTDPPVVLWNTPPSLGLFLGLIGLEWVLRKRRQMI